MTFVLLRTVQPSHPSVSRDNFQNSNLLKRMLQHIKETTEITLVLKGKTAENAKKKKKTSNALHCASQSTCLDTVQSNEFESREVT